MFLLFIVFLPEAWRLLLSRTVKCEKFARIFEVILESDSACGPVCRVRTGPKRVRRANTAVAEKLIVPGLIGLCGGGRPHYLGSEEASGEKTVPGFWCWTAGIELLKSTL